MYLLPRRGDGSSVRVSTLRQVALAQKDAMLAIVGDSGWRSGREIAKEARKAGLRSPMMTLDSLVLEGVLERKDDPVPCFARKGQMNHDRRRAAAAERSVLRTPGHLRDVELAGWAADMAALVADRPRSTREFAERWGLGMQATYHRLELLIEAGHASTFQHKRKRYFAKPGQTRQQGVRELARSGTFPHCTRDAYSQIERISELGITLDVSLAARLLKTTRTDAARTLAVFAEANGSKFANGVLQAADDAATAVSVAGFR